LTALIQGTMPSEGRCLSKNAYLLITAVALSAPLVFGADCPKKCHGAGFLQGRCVYDLVRKNCKKKECVHVVEAKCTPCAVPSCPPKDCCLQRCGCHTTCGKCNCGCKPKKCDECCKRGWFRRMGDWLREDPCQPSCGHVKKKCCDDGPTFYTPTVVLPPAKRPEVLPKPPVEVKPK